MKKSISSYIIYSIIFILAITTLLTIYRVQTTYTCLNNLQKIKNLIISSALSLNTSYSNMKIILEIPPSYEYQIYSRDGEVYIRDLRCNIKDKIDINITLVDHIISKEKIYLIKNFSTIYLSPYDIEINSNKKTDIFLDIKPISQQPNTGNDLGRSSEEKANNKIYFVYIRSEKHGGISISDSDLNKYAEVFTENTREIYTTSFKNLKYFNDSSLYDYKIVYSFLPVSYEDYGSNNFINSFSIFRGICQEINKENPLAIVFVILVNDPLLGYAGVSVLAIDQSYRKPFISKSSLCNAKILATVEINTAYYIPSAVAHEIGHAIGNLADQYVNGCGASSYIFDISNSEGINIFKAYEQYYGLRCNYLTNKLDAKIKNNIENLLNYYKSTLSKLFSMEYLKNEICIGDKIIILMETQGIIIVNITNPNHGTYIDLLTECNAIEIESSGTYNINNCLNFFLSKGIKYLDTYRDSINYCLSNKDITGITRDVMGNIGIKYFSETSIEAFKNNINKIWGISLS